LSAILANGFYMISYCWLIGTDLTFASRNYGLNIIHALARSFIWIETNFFTLRNVEVLIRSDKTQTLAQVHASQYKSLMASFALFISIPLEVLAFTLPIGISTLPMTPTVTAAGCIILIGTCPSRIFYVYKVLQLIKAVKTSREYFDPIQRKIEKLFKSGIIMISMAVLFTLFWCIIPTFRANMYIVYHLSMFIPLYSSFQALYLTSKDRRDNYVNSTDTTQNPASLRSKQPLHLHADPSTNVDPSPLTVEMISSSGQSLI